MEQIKVEDLHIKFTKEFYTLFNINFSLKKGEKLLIIAEHESGKTMLLRAVCGLEELDKGSVLIAGQKIADCLKEGKVQIGYLPTYPLFLDTKTVTQNLQYVLKNRHVDKTLADNKIKNVIQRFNLTEIANSYIYTLSFYEKIVVAIARLALRDLDVLLLDTFNTNLDEKQIEQLESYMQEFYNDENLTLIKASEKPYSVDGVKFIVKKMNNGSMES